MLLTIVNLVSFHELSAKPTANTNVNSCNTEFIGAMVPPICYLSIKNRINVENVIS